MSEIQRFRFEKTITAGCLTWEFLNEATDGEWVRYIDHRAEVERVIADVVKLRIDLNSVQVEASQLRGEAERLKGQVAALTVAVEQADEAKADAEAAAAREEAETDRVMVERDAAQAEVERLRNTLYPWDTYYRLKKANEHLEEDVAKLTVDRDAAQAEVERLKRMLPPTAHTGIRNGPGEGSWSVFAGKVAEERDEAREEVERLKGQVAALTVAVEQADKMKALAEIAAAWKEAKTDRVMSERDAARAEVERLTAERDEACGEVERLTRMTVADFALAQYRKRWLR